MERTKANFRALREMVGLSQMDVANLLECGLRSVKRWEHPTQPYWAPEAAWAIVEELYRRQREAVELALDKAEQADKAGELVDIPVVYYRDQPMMDMYGRDRGSATVVNATARAIHAALTAMGYPASFVYPVEETAEERPHRGRYADGRDPE